MPIVTRLFAFLLVLAVGGCAQLGWKRADVEAPAAPAKSDYEKVTEGATRDDGLFTLWTDDDEATLHVEVPDSLIGREMLVVSRVSRTAEGFQYGGAKTGTQALRWDRQGSHLLLRTVRYASVAADSLPIYQAVRDAQFEPVIARLEIQARGASGGDSTSVVEATDLFTSDVTVFGLPPSVRERYKVRRLDKERSFLARAAAFPRNVEIRSVLTYAAGAPPTNSATGTLSVEMAHSMVLLPDTVMRPRRYDPRVGYFSIGQVDYGLPTQNAERRRYITRWKLEPSDPEAYARGELVEPVEPIVYYIDPSTPVEWREWLKMGVTDWNVAFEAAGFKNAIRAEDPPADDPDWSPEDVRYSVIRYFPSDIQNAYGPHVHDPRSGQILESDIGWFHNVMRLLRNWFFVQTAAVNPDARGTEFREDVMGQLVRFVSAHEVGHTLGLPHNWISSQAYPVDSLRSRTFTDAHGTAPSIMDYARFNYIAQPGDGVRQLMPRVGEYDKWAIEWGYRVFPDAESEEEERRRLQALLEQHADDPALRFGSQTFDPLDPRSQNEDLGDDAVYASELGLANLKRILPNLREWAVDDGEPLGDLQDLYGQVVNQWARYLGHVGRQVGGVTITPRYGGEEGAVYAPVDPAMQRRAVAFLLEHGFQRPDWILDPETIRMVQPAGVAERVRGLQETALDRVLDAARLDRMTEAEWLGDADAYLPSEMLADLRVGLWAETQTGAAIDVSRRVLQRAHLDRLGELLREEPPAFANRISQIQFGYTSLPADRSDVRALARGELQALDADLARAERRYRAGSIERLHIDDARARIAEILDPVRASGE